METAQTPEAERIAPDPSGWLDRHGDALYRYALQRVRNRDVAEELVQETLLAALHGYAGFQRRSSQRTWLIAIMRRKIVDHFREKATTHQAEIDECKPCQVEVFAPNGKWRIKPSAWPRAVGSVIENGEFWKAFDHCFGALSPTLADAFCLCELEGLGTEDACRVLNVSASNLWTRLHRARHLLRRCLEVNWFSQSGGRS